MPSPPLPSYHKTQNTQDTEEFKGGLCMCIYLNAPDGGPLSSIRPRVEKCSTHNCTLIHSRSRGAGRRARILPVIPSCFALSIINYDQHKKQSKTKRRAIATAKTDKTKRTDNKNSITGESHFSPRLPPLPFSPLTKNKCSFPTIQAAPPKKPFLRKERLPSKGPSKTCSGPGRKREHNQRFIFLPIAVKRRMWNFPQRFRER